MWFLANDPRVPEKVRQDVNRWGLCKDEFTDTGGWPHQLYVREARRMISRLRDDPAQLPAQGGRRRLGRPGGLHHGLAQLPALRRQDQATPATRGTCRSAASPPTRSPTARIVPKEAECTNLLVPVCLSASHIAYGSIRMEPVFMVLGQSAATAACQAIDRELAVQQIDVPALRKRLREDGQVLEWTAPARNPAVRIR